jgi:hypothetical protein
VAYTGEDTWEGCSHRLRGSGVGEQKIPKFAVFLALDYGLNKQLTFLKHLWCSHIC